MDIALLGCGTVGGGVLEICERQVRELRVRRILTLPGEMEDDPRTTHTIDDIVGDDAIECVVEAMGGIEPAHSFIVRALRAGKSVVTANKAVVAAHFAEFQAEARAAGVAFMIEATSGGGVPWIASLEKARRVDAIESISGILNGTSNYIVDAMAKGSLSFDEALSRAQELGYAEQDPSADIDGIDVANKTIISSTVAFDSLCRRDIPVCGIRHLTKDLQDWLAERSLAIRLMARARSEEGRYAACVEPHIIAGDSLEANVPANFNLATLVGQSVGELKFYGQGAGALPTGNAIVQDLLDVAAGVRVRYATEERLAWDPSLLTADYLVATSAAVEGGREVGEGLWLLERRDPCAMASLMEAAAARDGRAFCASLSHEVTIG